MGSALKNLFKKESSTEDEIKQLVEEDEQVGQLEKNQREMINNIFEFDFWCLFFCTHFRKLPYNTPGTK